MMTSVLQEIQETLVMTLWEEQATAGRVQVVIFTMCMLFSIFTLDIDSFLISILLLFGVSSVGMMTHMQRVMDWHQQQLSNLTDRAIDFAVEVESIVDSSEELGIDSKALREAVERHLHDLLIKPR